MTLAQFKRMKPKYKFRLIMVCVVGFLLFLEFKFVEKSVYYEN